MSARADLPDGTVTMVFTDIVGSTVLLRDRGPCSILGYAVHGFHRNFLANRRAGLQSHGVNVVSGSLNPTWVEWLMGYPLGWTDLDASEMPSSPK